MKNNSNYIKEIKKFEFMARKIWPFMRFFVKSYLSKRCTQCTLSECYTTINESGICNICRAYEKSFTSLKNNSSHSLKEFNSFLNSIKGNRDYDIMVLFSGGKDSIYMTNKLLTEFPKLRLLAVTVDNGFLSPIAVENVNNSIHKLNVDHIWIKLKAEFSRKVFRYAFLNLCKKSAQNVDRMDGRMTFESASNLAATMQIPYVMIGLSSGQLDDLNLNSYNSDLSFINDQILTDNVKIDFNQVFNYDEQNHWWDKTKWDQSNIPQYIFPFYSWHYDEEKIKSKVANLDVIDIDNLHPLLTNHKLIPLMGVVDVVKLGYNSFEPEFALNVREGKADKQFWLSLFEMLEYSVKTGRFLDKSIQEPLDLLGLTKKDIGI